MKRERPRQWRSGGGTSDRKVQFMRDVWLIENRYGWDDAFIGPINHIKKAISEASCRWFGLCEVKGKKRAEKVMIKAKVISPFHCRDGNGAQNDQRNPKKRYRL